MASNRDNEKKVKTGEKLRIPASTYNSLVDMLRHHKRNKGNVGGRVVTDVIDPHNTILVKNFTNQNLSSGFKILRINDPVYSIQSDRYKFAKRPAIGGYIPQSRTDAIAITLAPGLMEFESEASDGSLIEYDADNIRAVVSGITLAYVKLNDANHEWANPVDGVVDYLESAQRGQVRIIYWEPIEVTGSDGSVISDGSTGFPEDVVLAIVHLIGTQSDNTVLWGRDNLREGCIALPNDLPFFDYTNYETAPGNSTGTYSRKILAYLDTGVTGNYGPFCYIPANSGRVLVTAGVMVEAYILKQFYSFIQDHGIFFDFSFDVVNVDSSGNLLDIELLDENDDLEFSQQDEETANLPEFLIRGLTYPEPIMSGQVISTSAGQRVYADYRLSMDNEGGRFIGVGKTQFSCYVTDTPVRLALRVCPKIAYTLYQYNGGVNDILMKWRPILVNEFPKDKGTFINYIKVQKDRDFCDIGTVEYASEGSFEGSQVGSVPEGSEGSTPAENMDITVTSNHSPGLHIAPLSMVVTITVDNESPVSPPLFYEIDWGDGTTDSHTTTNLNWTFRHIYETPGGPYTIIGSVTDASGNYGEDSIEPFTIT